MTPSKSGSSKSADRKSRTPPSRNRRSEILLEDMHGKISVIAEGHQMLVGRMDRLDTKMDKGFQEQNRQRGLSNKALTKRIDQVESSLGQRIDQVESSLGQRIDQVSGEVREVRAEVRELRTDIREHIAPRLDDHEARMAALEGKPAA